MDNQHRKISGYRELNQDEIDLMNEIKAFGPELDYPPHDEREFEVLSKRREEALAERRKPVELVAVQLITDLRLGGKLGAIKLADVLIARADDVNDALKPWDSGVRPMPDPEV